MNDKDRINLLEQALQKYKKIEIHGKWIWLYDFEGNSVKSGYGKDLRQAIDDLEG